ncbi:hypothetical protein QBC40DRAFT_48751 [Triangularia verruculosa]|uniref:Peptidase C14 caspase domain-containing protein n=1 Tax=Triangularia verruculosa TaxID=2587418 RepID=A0AAN6XJF9_9PEZI|nr:hypothetical protein QBC40DRAFT_48751 [Triangularia verruculosa]
MQAPNLAELPPKEDDGRAQQQQPHHHHQQQQYQPQQQQQQQHHPQQQPPPPPPPGGSPGTGTSALVNGGEYGRQLEAASPMRQNTNSSTTTVTSQATDGTTPTPYSLDTHTPSSPSLATAQVAAQAVFNARDGADVTAQRRASRRRTGPLNPEQREKASLIRKMGACGDCKRRRVACHPSHHNTTWEALTKKYGHGSPPSANGRPLSPAVSSFKSILVQDPEEMDVEPTPFLQSQLNQANPHDSRIRTPLPSGPRPERPTSMFPVAGLESFRADLQGSASRILASPLRSRYANISAMLVRWQDDEDEGAKNDMEELARVFKADYNYSVKTKYIPTSGDPGNSSYLWLNREVNEFVTAYNQRDTLKVFYYSGHSYLGEDRDTMISSSKKATPGTDIPWKMIQGMFENICSDALIILDCAYYPLYQQVRRQGMLELIAASAGEDHVELLGRSAFTRAVTEQLKLRAVQKFKEAYSATELHAKLVSRYPSLVREQNPEKETITTFPTPLFVQLSGNKVLPSILLAPLIVRQHHQQPSGDMTPTPYTPDSPAAGGSTISLTFQMSDDTFNMESWAEWLRSMPQGIRDLKVEGPFRNTFR